MIVRNEERDLPRCLESVAGLVDEIVVVDTGSDDRTTEVALGFGARVTQFAWRDDFSAARNAALSEARGQWILVLDADESIARSDHFRIREDIARTTVDALSPRLRYYVPTVASHWQPTSSEYAEGEDYDGYFDVEYRRLFRNAPWIRYVNAVHESIVSVDPKRPLLQDTAQWVIHHYGKMRSPRVLRERGEMYLRIGLDKARARPTDPLCAYELGQQYGELGRHREALEAFRLVERYQSGFRDTRLQIARCYLLLKRPGDALARLTDVEAGDRLEGAEVAFERGNALLALGRHVDAEDAYRHSLAVSPTFVPAALNLALVYQRTGKPSRAGEVLDQSVGLTPRNGDLRLCRAALRHQLGNHQGALDDLDAISRPGRRADALRAILLLRLGRLGDARVALMRIADGDGIPWVGRVLATAAFDPRTAANRLLSWISAVMGARRHQAKY